MKASEWACVSLKEGGGWGGGEEDAPFRRGIAGDICCLKGKQMEAAARILQRSLVPSMTSATRSLRVIARLCFRSQSVWEAVLIYRILRLLGRRRGGSIKHSILHQ